MRDRSEVKSTCCSCTGSKFNPVLRYLIPSPDLNRHQAHTRFIYIHAGSDTYEINFKKYEMKIKSLVEERKGCYCIW